MLPKKRRKLAGALSRQRRCNFAYWSGFCEHVDSSLKYIEIKTSIARDSLERALCQATVDTALHVVAEPSFLGYDPDKHIGQVVHQMLILSVNYLTMCPPPKRECCTLLWFILRRQTH